LLNGRSRSCTTISMRSGDAATRSARIKGSGIKAAPAIAPKLPHGHGTALTHRTTLPPGKRMCSHRSRNVA
jgi:hypothetical protein